MRYIYEITNLVNGKTYIGQRKLAEGRTWQTDTYRGSGVLLNKAKKKYGIENFVRKCLIIGDFSREEINELEKQYIAEAKAIGKAEYNLAKGGEGGCGIYTEKQKDIAAKTILKVRTIESCSKGGRTRVLSSNGYFGSSNPAYGKRWKVKDTSKYGKHCLGLHWYTNGINEVKSKECPFGYTPGRL